MRILKISIIFRRNWILELNLISYPGKILNLNCKPFCFCWKQFICIPIGFAIYLDWLNGIFIDLVTKNWNIYCLIDDLLFRNRIYIEVLVRARCVISVRDIIINLSWRVVLIGWGIRIEYLWVWRLRIKNPYLHVSTILDMVSVD